MQVRWQDNMVLGHPVMDAEHRQVIELLNSLGAAVESRRLDAARIAVEEFSTYTLRHFAHEERLALTGPHHDSRRHLATHGIVGQMIAGLKAALGDDDGLTKAGVLLEILATELIVQIYQEDAELARELID